MWEKCLRERMFLFFVEKRDDFDGGENGKSSYCIICNKRIMMNKMLLNEIAK